jgi:predicted hydrocarbon binding protein
MMGFFTALVSGGKMDKCVTTEEKCVCRGDKACEFHITMK